MSNLSQNTITSPTRQTGMGPNSSRPAGGLPVPPELTKMILRLAMRGLHKRQYISVLLTCKAFFRLGEKYIYEDVSLRTLLELEDFVDRFPALDYQLGMVRRLTICDDHGMDVAVWSRELRLSRDFLTIKLPQLHRLKTVSLSAIGPIGYVGAGWRGLRFLKAALAVLPESVEELELDTTIDRFGFFYDVHSQHFCPAIARILPRLVRFSWTTMDICPAAFNITSNPADGPAAAGALPPHPFPKLKELHLDVTRARPTQHHRCDTRLPHPIPYPTWTIESISQSLVPRLRAAIAAARFPALEHAALVRRTSSLCTHTRRDSGWLLALDLLAPASLSLPYAVSRLLPAPASHRRRDALVFTARDARHRFLPLAPYDPAARGVRDPQHTAAALLPALPGLGAWVATAGGLRLPGRGGLWAGYAYDEDVEGVVRAFGLGRLVGEEDEAGGQEMLRENVGAERRIAMFDERARRWEGALLEVDRHYGFMMEGWRAEVVGDEDGASRDEVDPGEDARLVWVGVTEWF